MAGYSGTPLVKKLGIKAGFTICIINEPPAYWDWIQPLPEDATIAVKGSKPYDFVHFFVSEEKAFKKQFLKAMNMIHPHGMVWVSWPKQSSKVRTNLNENIIREFGLEQGLVDVKVCAVSEVWSGLKFVYRKADR
jgi:hypothetical protein